MAGQVPDALVPGPRFRTLGPTGAEVYRPSMGTDVDEAADDRDWRSSRLEAIEVHSRARERVERSESERAVPLVAEFVRRAVEAGLAPVPLRARAYNGTTTYRTALTGWYLQPAGPLAIGTDGGYYVLLIAPGLAARWRGVAVEASPPPLAVGRGARDGESMSLAELLERRLSAGADFRRIS